MTDDQVSPTESSDTTPAVDLLVARAADITREMLREGIKHLQPTERDVLRLATRERLPVSTIAERTGLDRLSVEAHLRSGLITLRMTLLAQFEDQAS